LWVFFLYKLLDYFKLQLIVYFEPPCGCWELNSGPLGEQSVFSTSEASLQPIYFERKVKLMKNFVLFCFLFLVCGQLLDEAQVTLSFQDWLASVTERIHQTMHYQFDGK
jgi:hypothetical protein